MSSVKSEVIWTVYKMSISWGISWFHDELLKNYCEYIYFFPKCTTLECGKNFVPKYWRHKVDDVYVFVDYLLLKSCKEVV